MLTLLAYLRYRPRPDLATDGGGRGLLRFRFDVKTDAGDNADHIIAVGLLAICPFHENKALWKLILEKVPLVILSVGSCAATLIAQQVAIGSTESLPLALRIDNALVTYVNYLRQMFWPLI